MSLSVNHVFSAPVFIMVDESNKCQVISVADTNSCTTEQYTSQNGNLEFYDFMLTVVAVLKGVLGKVLS